MSHPTTGLNMRFDHVGVAVRSIDEALEYYVGVFGCKQVDEPVELPSEHVRVCMVEAEPGVRIELVEGLDDSSPVKGVLERFGGGTYHICYEVDDLDEALEALRAKRCRPFKRFWVPNYGHFAFVLTPDRQLFELCETTPPECRI